MTPEVGTELINPLAGTKTVFTAIAVSTDGDHAEIVLSSRSTGDQPRG